MTPGVALAHMRHSDFNLTFKTYTDLQHLDEEEAFAALPSIPLKRAATLETPPGASTDGRAVQDSKTEGANGSRRP